LIIQSGGWSQRSYLAALEKTLSKFDDKIQILRNDLSFVSQEKANFEGQVKQLQKLISIKQAEIP